MPWCIKAGNRYLWNHAIKSSRFAAVEHALRVYRDNAEVRSAPTRLAAWRRLRQTFGLRTVRVETVEVNPTGELFDAQRLALAVLRGDTQAALALADLVLETYHAAKQEGQP